MSETAKTNASFRSSERLIFQTLEERVGSAAKDLKNERLSLEARIASLEAGQGRDRAVRMLEQAQGALRLAQILESGGDALDFIRSLEDTPLPIVAHNLYMFGGVEAVQMPLPSYTPREGVEPVPPESTQRFRIEQLEEGV